MTSWTIAPSEFGNVVEKDLAALRTEVLLYCHRGIVMRTPVDTGRARGSWAISYGFPTNQNRIASSTGQAISRGIEQAARKADSPYEKAIISSSLPYIRKLESGKGSLQAPQGMVGITVVSAKARYSR